MKTIKKILLSFATIFLISGCGLFKKIIDTAEELTNIYTEVVEQMGDVTSITNDLNLPSSLNGATISYEVSRPDIIDSDLKVHRTDKDETVIITIKIVKDEFELEQTVVVIVKADQNHYNPDPNENTLEKLQIAFNKLKENNYTFNYSDVVLEEGDSMPENPLSLETKVDGNKIEFESFDNNNHYFIDFNETEKQYYLYYNESNKYEFITDEGDIESFFLLAQLSGYKYVDFNFNANDFELKDGLFSPKQDKASGIAKQISSYFNKDEDTLKELAFTLENERISKINLTYEYSVSDDTQTLKETSIITVTLKDYGTTSVTIPTIIPVEVDENLERLQEALDFMWEWNYTMAAVEVTVAPNEQLSGNEYLYISKFSGNYCEFDDFYYEGLKDYLVFDEDTYTYTLYYLEEDEWQAIDDSDDYFYYYLVMSGYYDIDFEIDAYDFDYVDGKFVPHADKADEICAQLCPFFDEDNIVDLYITLDGNRISYIYLSFTYEQTNDDNTTEVLKDIYTYSFYDYGKTEVILPDFGNTQTEETLGSLEEPLSVSEAIQIMKSYSANEESTQLAYVQGKVTSISEPSNYNTYNVFFETENGETFEVYSMSLNGLSKPKVGDTIIVEGYLKLYVKGSNTTYEIAYSNQNKFNPLLVSNTGVTKTDKLTASISTNRYEVGTSLETILANITVQYYDATTDTTKTLSASEYRINTESYNPNDAGTFSFVITYKQLSDEVYFKTIKQGQETGSYTVLKDAASERGVNVGLASEGDYNVLVIPLSFKNKDIPTNYKENLDKAFNGTSEETGYESLNSYYYKSSYGKLNIHATILDAYPTNESYSSRTKDSSGKDIEWLEKALTYYDSSINYSDYDYNNDGTIDCVYLVYLGDINYNDNDSLYWAFTNYADDSINKSFDGKTADYYMFFSYYFIEEAFSNSFIGYNGSEVNIAYNALTIIHESGHALGLDDYYDYGGGNSDNGGLGGSDMMDYNIGDHNPYSKAILGWINPTLVELTTTIELKDFETYGDAIIVAKDSSNLLFGEYFIIAFYTPEGLNKPFANRGMFGKAGIIIYQVDSTLLPVGSSSIDGAYGLTKYSNASGSKYKLIELVEADGNNGVKTNGISENSDLFYANSTYNSFKWHNKQSAGFSITVNSIGQTASITITF